jgi:hypothetical protein
MEIVLELLPILRAIAGSALGEGLKQDVLGKLDEFEAKHAGEAAKFLAPPEATS